MDDDDLHHALEAALAEAAAHPAGQPSVAAEHFSGRLAKRATKAASSQKASRAALLLAHEAFLGPRGSDALLDTAMLLIAEPLGRCADKAAGVLASETYRSLLGRMATSCSARDTVVALMAVLDEGQRCAAGAWLPTCRRLGGHTLSIHFFASSVLVKHRAESQQAPGSCGAAQGRPWRSSDSAAVHALPLALRRLQRQRARLLSDALTGALAHLPPAFAHAHALCAAGIRLASGAPAAQGNSGSEAAQGHTQLCNCAATASGAEPGLVADVSAFATAVAALPDAWGAAGDEPGIRESVRVFVLRLLAAATAGRALEPDLAHSGLSALHARAAAELAALQRGRARAPRLVAELAAGLLNALRQVPLAEQRTESKTHTLTLCLVLVYAEASMLRCVGHALCCCLPEWW